MVAPYSYSWNTGNAANGSTNTLTAKAYDRAGNVGESAVTVTVNR
jgi:chitinase